jgi:rhamnose utilization protein RhaD (predicted bifunctional aldolase and dehydrogenase)
MKSVVLRHEVEAYCARIGSDPMMVQGAGGNVSWKDGDVLWVKASGTWLKDALKQDIFVPVDLRSLNVGFENNNFSVQPQVVGQTSLRPSIETLLHGLMPHPMVVHLHAIEILSWMIRRNPYDDLNKRLINILKGWALVSYKKPGADLAQEIFILLRSDPEIDVLFLSNHGVVIGGSSVQDIDLKLHIIVNVLRTAPLMPVISRYYGGAITQLSDDGYYLINDLGIQQLALDHRLYRRLDNAWALYPDHVVFLGQKPFLATPLNYTRIKEDLPEIVFIKDIGVFSMGPLNSAKLAQLRCYYDVLARQTSGQYLNPLTDEAVEELVVWEAESYRRSIEGYASPKAFC